MRHSLKGEVTNNPTNQFFGVDFHDFIQKEQSSTTMEIAGEFGISLRAVKNMKRKIECN